VVVNIIVFTADQIMNHDAYVGQLDDFTILLEMIPGLAIYCPRSREWCMVEHI
jgi:hypothetical protein